MSKVLITLVVLVAACGPPPRAEGNNDYERGFQRGYERALEEVADCAENANHDTIGACLASYASVGLPGEVTEEYLDGIELAGLLIESEMLARLVEP